jgi:IS1 family transposase/transposase-like protein
MRRSQDWNQPCPNTACTHYGRTHQGKIRSMATYMTQSGRRRIFECTACGQRFSETRGTIFFDLRTSERTVMMALKMLVVRVSLSNISFILGTSEETVLTWLDRASRKADEINATLLRELPVTTVQMDELWSFVRRKVSKRAAGGSQESPSDAEDGRQWVWLSYAPAFRLILSAVVGPRTSETASTLVRRTAQIVSGVPAFFSDGFSAYLQPLIEAYHTLKTFPRTGKPGRPKQPRQLPHPDLVYGQVIKTKRKGYPTQITTHTLCGADRLAALNLTSSTTLLERLNLTFRQALAPLVRKTLSFYMYRSHLEQHVRFFQAFYNMARPHRSLQVPLAPSAPQFVRKWQPRTPAMAAGLTDHVWTFRELLTVKFDHVP